MKVLCLIIAIYFIYYINCDKISYCGSDYDIVDGKQVDFSPKSADDCKDRKLYGDKYYKCCYEYGSKKEDKGSCTQLDKYQYDKIGTYVKWLELSREIYEDEPETKKSIEEDGDYHIDCFSKYIKMSLFSILLILF